VIICLAVERVSCGKAREAGPESTPSPWVRWPRTGAIFLLGTSAVAGALAGMPELSCGAAGSDIQWRCGASSCGRDRRVNPPSSIHFWVDCAARSISSFDLEKSKGDTASGQSVGTR
jgi:hypothetical protein